MKLIISPHMDDAVLSLGGYLHQLNTERTHVLCIFNSVWTCLPEYFGSDVNSINKLEHETILQDLGCTWEYWEFPESNQRGYPYWYTPLDVEKDKKILLSIREELEKILSNERYTEIFIPMAIENHADHELLFRIMNDLITDKVLSEKKLFLYEDLPYAYYVDVAEWITMAGSFYFLKPVIIDITDDIEHKAKLLGLYKTQVEKRDIEAAIKYALKLGNGVSPKERLWEIEGRKIWKN